MSGNDGGGDQGTGAGAPDLETYYYDSCKFVKFCHSVIFICRLESQEHFDKTNMNSNSNFF